MLRGGKTSALLVRLDDKHHFGVLRGQIDKSFRYARLDNHRVALRWPRDIEQPTHVKKVS